jgi:hypothetical protein
MGSHLGDAVLHSGLNFPLALRKVGARMFRGSWTRTGRFRISKQSIIEIEAHVTGSHSAYASGGASGARTNAMSATETGR